MTIEENKRLIRHLHEEVMNRRDPDAYAAYFAPDTTNHGRPVGRAGIRRVLAEIFLTFPDWHNAVDEIIAEGDTVVIRNTTTATHLGTPSIPVHNLAGIAPSGKPVVMQSIHVFQLKDGLITSHRAVRDDLETMMQIGLWPPLAPTRAERAAADASAGGRAEDATALDRPPGRS